MTERSIVYLAVPYSHPDPAVRRQRFEQVNVVAGRLMRDGVHVFSPISHTHPIAEACDLPKGFDFWRHYDMAFLLTCCKVIVLMLDGWRESVGVAAEIEIATGLGLPIEYMESI